MPKVNLTLSWDDGSPYDLKLAELLSNYGISATFYIPKNNSESKSVLVESDIRTLAESFEVASHSVDHVRLNSLSHSAIRYQILESKVWLQDVIGNEVYGFCYPGGKYNEFCVEQVEKFGFYYSRTTENFCDYISNGYEMPTTLQLYDHRAHILAYNLIKSNKSLYKIRRFYPVLLKQNFRERVEFILNYAIDKRLSYLHFWGHSWELEDNKYWHQLEDVLKVIKEREAHLLFKTNFECAVLHSKGEL